jgi:hypothetical protein
MPVTLSFRQAVYDPESGHFPIALIRISHADLTDDILISTDPTQRIAELTTDTEVVYGTVSRGNTYLFFPVRLKLPDDTPDGPGEMQIEIDNVHQQYTETIREIHSPPLFNVELVMDDDPDTVEAQWPEFELRHVQYNESTITGTLKMESFTSEPFPAGSFTPAQFPGLF